MTSKKGKKVKIYNTKKKRTPESKIIEDLQAKYDSIDESKVKKFTDLPLSQRTLKGLAENNFVELTDIQRQSIGLALCGHDILGAAKTGSGKTLAFLIPVLEILYCKQWTRLDGVGALIITPSRELAYQIYETVRKIGHHHDMSVGLIIGGKDLKFERKRMDQCNIIICTPGRLLQHMDENPLFDCVNMQVLVLDEADRCLDMGFEETMNAIIENLPPKRQTLLFSATQTKSVRDLARLSLKEPMYVSVHEHATHTTPEGLQQSYVVCQLEDKLAMIWSFIRNHLKHKVIVFFSSCKQVKYTYEAFCRLKPGVSLLALYGTLHQLRRMEIYESFCKKQHAVLFATDIAARGLDFPAVNWVVQMDCPEDVNAYIHRAGRTARFQSGGESLLVLLPSEERMVEKLRERKIPINMIQINPNKLQSPQRKLEALLARDVSLKETAQRSFVAYVKSVCLMKDKEVFDVHALNTDAYAKSLGLAISPRIRFLQRMQKQRANSKKAEKNQIKDTEDQEETPESPESPNETEDDDDDNDNDDDNEISAVKPRNQSLNGLSLDESDDDDVLTIKRKNVDIDDELAGEDVADEDENEDRSKKKAVTRAAVAKKILRKKIVANKRTTFDEDGQELIDQTKTKVSELARMYETTEGSGIDIELAKRVLREEDKYDKQRFREMIKERHREERRKLKAGRKADKGEEESDKGEEEQSDKGEASEGSGEEEGPDLSWLPDPDKIYGKRKGSDQENSGSDREGSGSDREESESDRESKEESLESEADQDSNVHRPPKRRLITQAEYKKTTTKKKRKLADNIVNLRADEELALQLLRD